MRGVCRVETNQNDAESAEAQQLLRSNGWLDFEIALHRATRARTTDTRDRDEFPGRPQRIAVEPERNWPTQPLSALQERRRTHREFAHQPVRLDALFDVVVPAFITSSGRAAIALPGAVAAVGLTILVDRVAGLDSGVYVLDPPACALTEVRRGPFPSFSRCVDLSDVDDPAVVLVLTIDMMVRRKYLNAYELALLEAGQLLQNLALTAASVGLGACVLGSVFDEPYWNATNVLAVARTSLAHGTPLVAMALGHVRPDAC